MNEPVGLRELKKERTRETIAETAIRLFLAKGFDQVSVTEVAATAEVSRRTLFAYFPTKEDLVLQRFADHESEAARIVRSRPAGQDPLEALREALLAALEQRDPNTGLTDDPEAKAFFGMILDTESLAVRLTRYASRGIDALAEALREAGADPLVARLTAAQVLVVQHELAVMNHTCLTAGESAGERHPEAVRAAERAFDLLSHGVGDKASGAPPAPRSEQVPRPQ
ncbi:MULTISPECIES: TetR/AcrR family transcriptional regulator [unclassified Streptomyces]|uniref:TetR/AcrR family transcriptional regulator n=1 Tax=unclassified Streptomyces TaxID=2593676 RepID=UPI00081BC5B3|nr:MULTISPECIES: TetR/AcrR family transcriptional regulator [unclassified Streptomyces]MYX76946.1 TetR family transcriptional regulator [Streptomyces sp. SID3915]SCD26711.1 transcriptional regulator, TetR family [Streptomyces sp. BpilaLS-43]